MGCSGSKGSDSESGKKYTKEELKALKAEFDALDADHSGALDRQEFQKLFETRMKGTTPEQMDNFFKFIDLDNNGTIEFEELRKSLELIESSDNRKKLEFLFMTFDTDRSGSIDGPEIQGIVNQMRGIGAALGRQEAALESFIQGLLKKLDADGNGNITKEEWIENGLNTPSVITLLLGQ